MSLNSANLANGSEQHEMFRLRSDRKKTLRCQYDYRHTDGVLFSCVALSLDLAREKRDRWLSSDHARNDFD